jgi:hypothetical protein
VSSVTASARGALGEEQWIDLTVLIGYYRLLVDVLLTCRIEIEDGVGRLRVGELCD